MTLSETRRENIRQLVKTNGGTSAVAKRLGYRNPSFLSQLIGPKPTREVTEKTARGIEQAFELPEGTLDRPGDAPQALQPTISTELVADIIRLVGTTLAAEGVSSVGPEKFSTLVALAFVDAMDHQGQARPDHVRTIARLLK